MIVFKFICVIFLIVVILCMWKTTEFFTGLSDMHKYRGVIAWDLLILFVVMVYLIFKTITL